MKEKTRKKFISERDNLAESYRKLASEKIFKQIEKLKEFKNLNKIFIYVSFGSEVATEQFIKKYLNEKKIFVPKISGEEMLIIPLHKWEELRKKGAFGILEPTNTDNYVGEMDIAIVPSVVYDKKGYRIGYGKGYYDKYLSKTAPKLMIGVSYEKILQENLPIESHDIAVDFVITEKKVRVINENYYKR
ncbi:5-formyltetrahydrofolate cyclo-ligase [Gemella sp. oral taxon 928]|uniref:5-formyltetrahydrofolate cyclo-ligase n=1 Tax=Gemella sp. oral taxon 928 TaxID=1785995 RepID=UPI000768346E|nr:5-formyltetrahydrofolate cyclo-ligase [Gemella sp. oral taxon 928]AME10047.1 5-formyltetrahydrofolate cyclo-ligase [Gemella sp. oral taxon 928]